MHIVICMIIGIVLYTDPFMACSYLRDTLRWRAEVIKYTV